jgi:hypothetical protein
MVVHWWRKRPPGWQRNLIMNLIGALVTFVVFAVATLTKLDQGTWLVIVLIPVLMAMFMAINRHYRRFEEDMAVADGDLEFHPELVQHTVIVPVARLNSVVLRALSYARSISPNVTAVHIHEGEDPEEAERFNKEWRKVLPESDIPLVIIESPYRSLVGPLLSYIDALDQQTPDDTITIVLPELLPSKPWEYLLHGQSALRLKAALLFRPNTVLANVPYVIGQHRRGNTMAEQSRAGQFPWGILLAATVALLLIYYFWLGP